VSGGLVVWPGVGACILVVPIDVGNVGGRVVMQIDGFGIEELTDGTGLSVAS